MDFFEAQDRAKKKTKTLVFLFILAVLATGIAIYFVVTFGLIKLQENPQIDLWDWPRVAMVVGITALVMGGCSLYKISRLQSGGGAVAKMLGGQRLPSDPKDFKLQQLRNVVEEMAIASGVRIPEIYVLEQEPSINAFAAGYTLDNAAVAVSRGALEQLDREELQGVIAHEFSHILNGDMRINTRLIGIIFGILVIAVIGRAVLHGFGRASLFGGARRSRRSDSGSGGGGAIMVILLVALAVMIIGFIGVFFGRLIQSAISRQREYLADAAAVQFTRNPSGIANALRRIKAAAEGSRIAHPDAEELSHMFFANALKRSLGGSFSTHPPLEKRIKAIDPTGIHSKPLGTRQESPREATAEPAARRDRADFVTSIAKDPTMAAILAGTLLQSLPKDAQQRAHDPIQAFSVIAACLDPMDTTLLGKRMAPRERFTLLDLALASLKDLSQDQLSAGLKRLQAKANEDERISFDEQCLLIAVRRNLNDWNQNADGKLLLLPEVKKETEILLSAIAALDAPSEDEAAKAFASAQPSFQGFGTQLSPRFDDANNQELVNLAIERASHSIFKVRKAIIDAAARIASSDDTLSDHEQTHIRSLCLALACPLPT